MLQAASGRIPHKNDLDLANFAAIMPHLALVAITKPDRCLYRVAGERLKERVGLNLAGRNYYDFVEPERRQIAAAAMHMVIDTPCAFRAEIRQTYSGDIALMIEASGFPLLSSERGVDGFILFADQGIDQHDELATPNPILQSASLRRRDLIDLGSGIDDTFEDLIEAS
ncbi:PAS domain-containing protein [Dongia rigui]|uniref:PAS domain-containing protein n=1 Tax=Dongia rigui TaxID=940149 RepID=A0ABU5E4I1_9PROT|nr:PAS domain-containing protein [Dongia rigui]MDY0874262.1 PAS domain-containing protein [Dongia rigui]